jgi:hypothetical protein
MPQNEYCRGGALRTRRNMLRNKAGITGIPAKEIYYV